MSIYDYLEVFSRGSLDMNGPESFEVLGTGYDQSADRNSVINQVTEDMISDHAGYGFKVKFQGEDEMVVTYHSFEMDLPQRAQQVEEQAERFLRSYEKRLKRDYKSYCGKTLKFKELKDQRAGSVEKVSLNNRYYFRSSRTYKL